MDDAKFNELVKEIRDRFHEVDELQPAEVNRRVFMYVYPAFYEARQTWLQGWIDESRTDKHSWDTLCLIAQDFLRRGLPPPGGLRDWVADVLANNRPRPGKGKREARRDDRIVSAVIHLMDHYNLNAIRRTTERQMATQDPRYCNAEGGTACDVVGKAFDVGFSVARNAWDVFQRTKKKK